jgi:hypothetical protein
MTVAAKPKNKFSYRQALNYRGSRSLGPNEKTGVTIFLLFYFVVVGSWLMDNDYIPNQFLIDYTKAPMEALGWTQHWSLFAPWVRTSNYHSLAIIEFADGSNKAFEFPRTLVDQKDFSAHFGGEKKRKFFGDNMLWPGWEQFLPSIARYIARANDDPNNPPRMVTLAWQWADTPLPDPAHWVYRDQLPYHTLHKCRFVYAVMPEDLQSSQKVSATK